MIFNINSTRGHTGSLLVWYYWIGFILLFTTSKICDKIQIQYNCCFCKNDSTGKPTAKDGRPQKSSATQILNTAVFGFYYFIRKAKI